MKLQKIKTRLLLPAVVLFLLLPPLSCAVFHWAAQRYAYAGAVKNMGLFQKELLPVMEQCFGTLREGALAEEDPSTAGSGTAYRRVSPRAGGAGQTAALEQVQTLLRQASSLMRRMDGNAGLILLDSEMQMVYPRAEQAWEEDALLAEDIAAYIQTGRASDGTAKLSASSGISYLLNIYEAPGRSARIRYLAVYSPMDKIGDWVLDASRLMLVISYGFESAALLVFVLTACSITQPLQRLCRESERIGSGSFDEIGPPFPLAELEELRLAMNRMSEQLQCAERQQQVFFQNISHELRNPLMSISGYAQGIEQGVFRTPANAARTILEESSRLTGLVNRLLTLSRLENMQKEYGTLHVMMLLEDCIDRFSGLALKKGIALVLEPADENLSVRGEEELFVQVMDNLLSNALRYARTAVTITAVPIRDRVRIEVSDDGGGIAAEDLPHVFERSYRGQGGNYGLGLAIAQAAAQKIGGVLSASNRPDGGAVFTAILAHADDASRG